MPRPRGLSGVQAWLSAAVLYSQAGSLRDVVNLKLVAALEFQDDGLLEFGGLVPNITTTVNEWEALPDWIRNLGCAIAIILGFILIFFGSRFPRFAAFFEGGFIAAVFCFGITAAAIPNDFADKTATVYGTSLAVWILVGTILACCLVLLVITLGFALGAIVALMMNPISLKYIWVDQPTGMFRQVFERQTNQIF
jgi:hypothetical protein